MKTQRLDFKVSETCLGESSCIDFPLIQELVGVWVKQEHVLFPTDKDAPILDIGSGDGRFLRALREVGYTNLTGIDPFPRGEDLEGINIIKGDGVNMEFPEESFDRFYSRFVFDAINYKEQTLEIRRIMVANILSVLKKGGVYAGDEPCTGCFYYQRLFDENPAWEKIQGMTFSFKDAWKKREDSLEI